MISDLLPNLAELADDISFIHSMTAKSNTHGPAENQMSTGFTLDGFPGIGAWVSYALGSECRDLPAFVAIPDPAASAGRLQSLELGLPPRNISGDRVQCRTADSAPEASRLDCPCDRPGYSGLCAVPQ